MHIQQEQKHTDIENPVYVAYFHDEHESASPDEPLESVLVVLLLDDPIFIYNLTHKIIY